MTRGVTTRLIRRNLVTRANKGIGHAIARAIVSEHDDTFVYSPRAIGNAEKMPSRRCANGPIASRSSSSMSRATPLSPRL